MAEPQDRRVNAYKIDVYTHDELNANPDAIISRASEIGVEFVVYPQR